MHEKYQARLYIKQFITFIKKQTGNSIKYLWLDQGQELYIQD